jgi:hypothetical protein
MTDLKDRKLILAIDFDGVIHDYKRGWSRGQLYGHATPGFFDWYLHTSRKFEIIIHSSRFEDAAGIETVRAWLDREYATWRGNLTFVASDADPDLAEWVFAKRSELGTPPEHIDWVLSATMPPAWLTIASRCARFDGNWADEKLSISGLYRFRPYHDPRP